MLCLTCVERKKKTTNKITLLILRGFFSLRGEKKNSFLSQVVLNIHLRIKTAGK